MTTSQVTTLESQAKPQAAGAQASARSTITVKAKGNNHDVALSGKTASITLHPAEGPSGQDAHPVGINGYMYQVPRGMPVQVPIELLWVLQDAVTEIVSTGKDGSVETRRVPRFAFTVHSMDSVASA